MKILATVLFLFALDIISFDAVAGETPAQTKKTEADSKNPITNRPQLPAIHQQTIVIGGFNGFENFPKILCHPHAVHSINMENNSLKNIASCISNHALTLKELILNDNKISELPNELGDLTLLEELGLAGNELASIPKSLGQLSSLTSLNLSNNKLSSLPREIGNLRNLRILDLRNNNLSSLPFEISNLTNLNELWLSDDAENKLLTAPEFLPYLVNLTRLVMKYTPPLPLDQQEVIRAVFKDNTTVKIEF